MEAVGRLTFVALDGEAPAELGLETIPAPAPVAARIRRAFAAFMIEDREPTFLGASQPALPPPAGLHIVYAYGHAWLTPQGPLVAVRGPQGSSVESAEALLRRLLASTPPERTVLWLDCCYAAAFEPALMATQHRPRLVVFASAASESAIALSGEQASRLSLALEHQLARSKAPVDLIRVIADVRDRLEPDGVLPGQSVSYLAHGPAIRLTRTPRPQERSRERTVSLIRNVLLAAGGSLALALVALTWFYWSHALADIDLQGLPGIAEHIRIVASEETPSANGSQVFIDRAVNAGHTRLWIPAADVIIHIHADYADHHEHSLAFHLDLTPSMGLTEKLLNLAVPSAKDIEAHPDMAYIPQVAWFHGRDRERQVSPKPYWIDLRPPTAEQYLPIAQALERDGHLQAENSFLLMAHQQSAAIDATGLGQVRQLSKDLGQILGVIDEANSPQVSAPSDIVVGAVQAPCPTCPAPMTRHEAQLYCAASKKRLPTDLEWELAVRGVDGRVYPWGNEFDEHRANVPGLPQKGDPPASLKPVDAYPTGVSPFGLIDTVGNAGDWVINESGSYERVYMGATYQFNPEDATAFRMLPITDSDYLLREITARCAQDASPTALDATRAAHANVEESR